MPLPPLGPATRTTGAEFMPLLTTATTRLDLHGKRFIGYVTVLVWLTSCSAASPPVASAGWRRNVPESGSPDLTPWAPQVQLCSEMERSCIASPVVPGEQGGSPGVSCPDGLRQCCYYSGCGRIWACTDRLDRDRVLCREVASIPGYQRRPSDRPCNDLGRVSPPRKPLTNAQVVRLLIKESIDQYPGNCPCPDYADSAGRRCGGRSAWSRDGGYAPLCYRSDVSPQMIADWRVAAKARTDEYEAAARNGPCTSGCVLAGATAADAGPGCSDARAP